MSLIEKLKSWEGRYLGQGISHDGEGFQAELKLESLRDCKGIKLDYTASREAQLLHHEHAFLAHDSSGTICLWALSSNTEGLLCHALIAEEFNALGDHLCKFEFGDTQTTEGFRENILLTLHKSGALSYSHNWGLPGEALKDNSHAKLFPSRVSESV
ncbi:hypothetical protein COW36_09495 [bacterium (Candidatus Blackallbacteria) CG17_big_fil_post_rev_8_21_14_2_50_48_46]|uniref:Uncharacterized protein n=1 Tax=bacterium (Candidatus Blackallbacteria) CG17_big_fil_post_rev_8_21_14_2_50_48_46 TaxID=2014261 RepID=A0A2M7G5J4_9BACT|nr:MAG: hypothetical protein COW64_01915 [bacterium (Candidatus Blackallbacteria) CG18_big_fil_WC_8_21_14_2_50_49_26]PIW17196.1 MAG: hypothetical protein COW36_09495 [bacterium (Candidatus Blackallbacteria) CG17_big_fil_post_rev_8_21_14_2_50_48_46]PIW50987.1 MAG: hypothetical protein COW20_00505 [bacterium (Candidatus Blackallbacteria) CG13_big_fil_rev_8_21_14_2_50_49_14]